MTKLENRHCRSDYGALESTLMIKSENLQTPMSISDADCSSLILLNVEESQEDPSSLKSGSSWFGASLNLTSSIVGAGCIGIGGAIAESGGIVSFLAISGFAVLSKLSFDLVTQLAKESVDTSDSRSVVTYEDLGYAAYGPAGQMTVIVSKGLYSFGCLVAYIVIVKNNLAAGIVQLLRNVGLDTTADDGNLLATNNRQDVMATAIFCTVFMLPLCMMRDVSSLERYSAFKISVVLTIVAIVIYLWATTELNEAPDFVGHWVAIHGGMIESLGTYVFAFAAQHAIHLVYQSIKPAQRQHFHKTTTLGTILSSVISMSMGFFVYMTFWEKTTSDMFHLYKPSIPVAACRILLSMSMLLTYPFPFLTVRELLVLLYASTHSKRLVLGSASDVSHANDSILFPGGEDQRQLKQPYHIALSFAIWIVTLFLALGAPSLGMVLNLTGCATGTMIAYVMPAMFAFRIQGITAIGILLLSIGGIVGLVGTYFSLSAIFQALD